MGNLLKVNSRDCVSLLTTCNMSKTSVKSFLVYYEHAFFYCDAFVFKISFLVCLLSILNRFHALILNFQEHLQTAASEREALIFY